MIKNFTFSDENHQKILIFLFWEVYTFPKKNFRTHSSEFPRISRVTELTRKYIRREILNENEIFK